VSEVCRSRSADSSRDGNGAGAAVDLLHTRSAVAASIIGLAVEELATRAGGQDVVLAGEGIAPLTGTRLG
jgi:hypothetical protein